MFYHFMQFLPVVTINPSLTRSVVSVGGDWPPRVVFLLTPSPCFHWDLCAALNHHSGESRKSQQSFTRHIASYLEASAGSIDWSQCVPFLEAVLCLDSSTFFFFQTLCCMLTSRTKSLSWFCVIKLIFRVVNQFFQMVGRKHACKSIPAGLLSENMVPNSS